MVSKASDDLPLPERPVRTIRLSLGRVRSMFLRLCSLAPRMSMVSCGTCYLAYPEPVLRPPTPLRAGCGVRIRTCVRYSHGEATSSPAPPRDGGRTRVPAGEGGRADSG